MTSCGKPKTDGDFKTDQILPRTIVTRLPNQDSERIKVFCYYGSLGGALTPAYKISGSFYLGNIFMCEGSFNTCMGRGIYVHYFIGEISCLSKKGFEEQFTLCLKGRRPEEQNSNVGQLVKLNLTNTTQTNALWCEKKILKII